MNCSGFEVFPKIAHSHFTGNPDSKLISKFGIDNVYKATCCALDWLATDEKVQVNGVATFCDQSDLDYMVMTKFWTPSTAKAFLHFFQVKQLYSG